MTSPLRRYISAFPRTDVQMYRRTEVGCNGRVVWYGHGHAGDAASVLDPLKQNCCDMRSCPGSAVLVRQTTATSVLHGESNRGHASPRTTIQRMCQPQEAVQTQRNQTILQCGTPAQKKKWSYKWSHPKPHQVNAHVARTQGRARTHLVTRRVTTQYLHTQSVFPRRRCGRNDTHEAPRELYGGVKDWRKGGGGGRSERDLASVRRSRSIDFERSEHDGTFADGNYRSVYA